MKRFYWILTIVLLSATTHLQGFAQTAPPLSREAEISLITCSPTDDAVFTLYGHTALRVYDPVLKIDWVYNYGIFDFSSPNFIYRFAKGETDYKLDTSYFSYFLMEYSTRGSTIYEQVLNLLPEEKESLWQALEWNRKPENRVYRYNFFFDNCATRPAVMVENNIKGYISYAPASELPTFRDVINYCTRNHPWITLGCDLVVGLPSDRVMTLQETFFIPDYLKNAFDKAEIIREDTTETLVKQTNILANGILKPDFLILFPPTPFTAFTVLFVLILALSFIEWRRKSYYRFVDVILFLSAGLAGCIIFFLSFFSVHPSMFPNINLLWLHPLHLIGVLFFSVKKWKIVAFWYHFINFAVVMSMCVGWIFIPQHFNMAFIPLIASLLLRSGGALLRKKNLIR